MNIVVGILIGVVVICLAMTVLAHLVSIAAASFSALLPGLIILWFIIMVLRGMVRTIFK